MGGSFTKEPPRSEYQMKQRPTLGAPLPNRETKGATQARVNTVENKIFSEEILAAHNEYRALHKVPPLKISKKLSTLAQEWSERLTMIGMSEARPGNKFGESIYWSRWASDAKSVCSSWYKEGKHYKYDKEPDPPPTHNANFTQMIWKNTSELGVGRAVSWSNVTYIVCYYKVKGNTKGEYMKNIIDPGSTKKRSTCEDPKAPSPTSKAQVVTGSPTPLVDANFLKLMLRLTNEFRFVHGVRGLKLSGNLNEAAQKEAEKMALLKKLEPSNFTHVGGSFYASKWSYEPKDVTQFWYKESKRFKFGVEPEVVPLSTLDFTQMIWSSTNEVGYGRAQATNGFVYIVAYYRPKGYIRGEFVKNVKPFNFNLESQHGDNKSDSFQRKRSVSRAVVQIT